MNKKIVQAFMYHHKRNEPLIIESDLSPRNIDEDVDNGFIEEINPSYDMERDYDGQLQTITRRRYVPTDLGLEFLRFKLL